MFLGVNQTASYADEDSETNDEQQEEPTLEPTPDTVTLTLVYDIEGNMDPSVEVKTFDRGAKLIGDDLENFRPTRRGFRAASWYTSCTYNEDKQMWSYTGFIHPDSFITLEEDLTVYAAWVIDDGDYLIGEDETPFETDDTEEPATPSISSGGLITPPAEAQDKDTEDEDTNDNDSSGSTVPDGLNGDNHIAYISGYPDGSVQPKSSITRAEVATVLYRLLTDNKRNELNSDSDMFSDVPENAWYRSAVNAMADGGYITGYPDGTFRGNDNISRAEFVAVMARFLNKNEATCTFTDVKPGYWAYSSIARATTAGWLDGYTDGSFRPTSSITRAEVMRIINRVLNRGVDENSELLSFAAAPDNTDESAWFYYDVIEATNAHSYSGSRPSEQWASPAA
jgi:hypothetical protein